MDIAGVINLLKVVAAELPGAITTVTQLVDLGQKFYATANGREPTAAEVLELRASIDADVAEALTPLPPPRPGDPDADA
jgi:hypothetical protein